MPTTVAEALASAGLTQSSVVRWGTKPSLSLPGVYVVSLSASVDSTEDSLATAPLTERVFERWLEVRPKLTLDGNRPTIQKLMSRIEQFWLGYEVILYIGKATSISSRVGQYYRTPIGARSPHAGGYFLKLLVDLDALWVHYAPCSEPSTMEDRMLRQFCGAVSTISKSRLRDPAHPFPFANLEWPARTVKDHGIRGAREPRQKDSDYGYSVPQVELSVATPLSPRPAGKHRTQRVTKVDLQNNRIRIPSVTKSFFPFEKARFGVLLRGESVSASWDPKMGPDKERSGVLRVGSVLRQLVRENEELSVSSHNGGIIAVD